MSDQSIEPPTPRDRVRTGMRRWFRTPPRQHGEVDYGREVSFLELFYDLVYVVVIGQAAHHLAEHVGWQGVADFAIVFGLIFFVWFNGTLWHELHGREDGRSRLYIFGQMGLITLLAVFAGDATGDDGPAFALVYTAVFLLLTWQWYVVHRTDEDPRYRPTTTRYVGGMLLSVAAMAASAFVGESVRFWIWVALVVGWSIVGVVLPTTSRTEGYGDAVSASLVERFGLVTIIVLGEVVIGVVAGIGDVADRDAMTIAVGILGLGIGMGIWWNYFDLLGRRVPTQGGGRLAGWMSAHLPMTMAIAAAGAAMVSLVEHAGDGRTPAATAWLLGASVAMVLAGIALASRALSTDEFPDGMARHIVPTFTVAAVLVLAVTALRPAPVVLVVGIDVVLLLTWLWLFVVFLARGGAEVGTK